MYLLSNRIHERIIAKKKRLDQYRPLNSALVRQLKKRLLIEYTYASNALEGNTLTLGETRMIIEDGVTIGGKSFWEHLEARNHPKAINYIEELAIQKREAKEEDILRLHGFILENINDSAGKYREGEVRIAGSTFSPPPSREVPSRVVQLLEWLKDNPDELRPIELAAFFMHRFTQIHPFIDGNGRVARLLLNIILIRAGYPFITNISYRDRVKYLRCLQEADEGSMKPLVNLIALSVEQALDNYLRAIEEPRVLTLAEASRQTEMSQEYLGLLSRTGRLGAVKRDSRWSVSAYDLQEYVNSIKNRSKKGR